MNESFVLKEGILFKLSLIYGVQVFRLCLPFNFSREILSVMHRYNSGHMNMANLRLKFKENFWCADLSNLIQSIKNNCLFCRLNQNRRQVNVKGENRRNQYETTVGAVWFADVLYLAPSNSGHRYILTLTEKVSSYICAIPLKRLNVTHVRSAMENFLSICPQMREIQSDHGRADLAKN